MAKAQQGSYESNLREIGKQLGIVGSDYTDSFAFRSKNGQALSPEEKTAAMNGNQVRWDLPALLKMINEQSRNAGPATLRDIQNSLYLNVPGVEGQPINTTSGTAVRKAPGTAKSGIPTQEKSPVMINENGRTGGAIGDVQSYLNNILIPKIREAERTGKAGPVAAGGQFVDDLMNGTGDQADWMTRLLSDTTKGINKNLFGTTQEERLTKEVVKQNPELQGKLKTKMLRSKLAGMVFHDPASKQRFTFDKNGAIVRA
jgi:hypothetical protein